MKKLMIMVLVCLLLTGCGETGETAADAAPEETANTLPATAPVEPISAPAVVTEGQVPGAYGPLPENLQRMVTWDSASQPVALLAQVGDAGLYGIAGEEDRILLRWGDTSTEFIWPYRTPQTINPALWQLDADGDGTDELAVACHYGSGTGVSIDALHIVEKNDDGTLTDYCFPEDVLCGELTKFFQVGTIGDRIFVILGQDLVEITDSLEGSAAPQGLIAGSIVHFDVNPDDADGIPIRFHGSAYLDGEDYPPTVWYLVDITAAISYENGSFTLSDFHLDSLS